MALMFLKWFLHLIVAYGLAGAFGAMLFVIGATIYVFPSQAAIFVGGCLFACIVIALVRSAYRRGAFTHWTYDRFLSFPGARH
jgi:hypothetical protein